MDQTLPIFYNVVASVLAGAVMGDHCSPISDTTIMSSMSSGCDHLSHVGTQKPYALTVGGVALLFGVLPTALGLPSAVFAQSTDFIAQWSNSGAGWTDSNRLWAEVSSDAFPESSATYFCDTSRVNGTDRIYHSISNLYPETGTIKWNFSVVCNT